VRTYTPKPNEVARSWHVIDAEGRVLGRLASEIASLLRGKHKPQFSYHVDLGDHVIVVNADKLVVSADKARQKIHYRHTGYPGGLKETRLGDDLISRPQEVLRRSVKGMLPKNRLARKSLKRLRVYAGPDHPHQAQLKSISNEREES